MESKLAKIVGEGIRRQRLKCGLTQRQLAELTLKTTATISNFERGKTLPGLLTLESLANRMGVAMKTLLDEVPHKSAPLSKTSPHVKTIMNSVNLLPDEDLEIVASVIKNLESQRRRKTK